MGHQLGLRGEHLFALEAAVRPGLPVDAGGVLGQVAPPEGRVVTLFASGRIRLPIIREHFLIQGSFCDNPG